jgi:RNA polymerase sigma factor, sigma-70 family
MQDIEITDYQNLVRSFARKYSYNDADYEDMYQEGMKKLWELAENFDTNMDVKFSTYAYLHVMGAIIKYGNENKTIKISKDLVKLNRSINNMRETLTQKLMRAPTYEELSSFCEVPVERIFEAEIATDYVRSADYAMNIDDDGKDLTVYDSVAYEETGYDERIIDLRTAVKKLPVEDRQLIYSRYYEDLNQSETASILGTSQVQVSRKEGKVLAKLYQDMAA